MTRLDPDVLTFLAAGAEHGGPPLEELGLTAARARMKELLVASGPETITDVGVRDLRIKEPAGDIPLRIYRPLPSGETPLPVVLFIHGGGWLLCDLDCYDGVARQVSNDASVIVASVGYRLAPEHVFPAGLRDCVAAWEWLSRNAADMGGDPRRIVVMGDSSGGNLAAALCLTALRAGLPGPAGQALLYPILDLREDCGHPSRRRYGGGDFFITEETIAWTIGHYLREPGQATQPMASPILAASFEGLPKTLVVTAGCDPLRDDGAVYADLLSRAGVPVHYHFYESAIHGFLSFAGVMAVGRLGLRNIANWLRDNFHDPMAEPVPKEDK